MFCEKCGTQNPDNAAFCKKCGTKLSGRENASTLTTIQKPVNGTPQHGYPAQKNRPSQDRMIGMIAIAVIAVVLLITAVTLLGGRSYQATIKQFISASTKADAGKLVKLIPKGVLTYTIEDADFDDLDELIEELNQGLQYSVDSIKRYVGDDWSFSYKILSAKNISGNSLKQIQKTYQKYNVKVSAAKNVKVELTVKAGKNEVSRSVNVSLIKSGRSWYIDVEHMDSIF